MISKRGNVEFGGNFTPPDSLGVCLALMREAGADEAAEERMRLVRFALEFGVILASEEEGVIAQLD